MHRFLHLGVEILDPHRDPVEPQAAQRAQLVRAGDARVDLDPDFGVGRQREPFARVLEELLELRGVQVGRGPASPVQLDDGPLPVQPPGELVYFPPELLQVGECDVVIPVDDDVAAAEEAQPLAEREMHVEGDGGGRARAVRTADDFVVVVRAETVEPLGRGRVTGIARPGDVVAVEDFSRDVQRLALKIDVQRFVGHKN